MQIISYYRFYVLYNLLNTTSFLKIRTAAIEIYFTPRVGGLFRHLLFNNRLVFYLYLDEYSKIKGQSSTWFAIFSSWLCISMDPIG